MKTIQKFVLMSPNQLTYLRMILTPIFAGLLTFEDIKIKIIALFVFIIASLTDWYDGYVARKFGPTTTTGKYLDPLADKFLVSSAFGMFAYLGLIPFWMFLVMAVRDLAITGLRAYARATNKPFETSSLAKWKTACQMVVIYFLLIWIIAFQHFAMEPSLPSIIAFVIDSDLVWHATFVITIYTFMTGIFYLYENRTLLKSLAIACYRVFVPTNVR